MSWSADKTVDFIKAIQLHSELWDISSDKYRDRNLKNNKWTEIAIKFNVSVDVARSKFKSLRTYFRHESRKMTAKKKRGGDADSPWFLYKQMAFLPCSSLPEMGKETFTLPDEVSGEGNSEENDGYGEETNENEQEDDVFSPNLDTSETTVPKKRLKKSPSRREDKQLAEAYNLLKNYPRESRNQYSHFGNHVASKLCNYETRVGNLVQYKISQILFEADMGHYDSHYSPSAAGSSSGSPSPTLQTQQKQIQVPVPDSSDQLRGYLQLINNLKRAIEESFNMNPK